MPNDNNHPSYGLTSPHTAISRAAALKVLRETVGLNADSLARIARVNVRSVNRWESPDGRGYCPDDVLETLQAIASAQAAAIETATSHTQAIIAGLQSEPTAATGTYDSCEVAYKSPLPNVTSATSFDSMQSATPAVAIDGQSSKLWPVKAASLSYILIGSATPLWRSELDSAVKGLAFPYDARTRVRVRMCYYPNQRTYEFTHESNRSYYGVANTTARMIARRLEELGCSIAWRYVDELDADADGFSPL